MSLAKKLAKDSFIYGLGGLFTNGITFLLSPIYTRIFSPSEYGTIEMLLIISNFVRFMRGAQICILPPLTVSFVPKLTKF